MDQCPYLPNRKTIERKFGGMLRFRELLSLEGQVDYTTGAYSSDRAKMIGKRAHEMEKKVYDELVLRFGRPFVHREYFFTDDRRTRADFYVYGLKKNFLVDIFYPKDRRNMIGCLNNKYKKYLTISRATSEPVLFVMMNEDMNEGDIRDVVSGRKRKLLSHQSVITFKQFIEYCETVEPRKIT